MFINRLEFDRMKKELEELKREKEVYKTFFIDPMDTVEVKFPSEQLTGTLKMGNTIYPVYIGSIERTVEPKFPGKSPTGLKFTLISYKGACK